MRAPILTFGPFAFDPNSKILRRGDDELALPPRVTGVLEVLLSRAGDVVPRQELIDSVWKDAFVTDTSLAEAVSVLRQTLGDDPQTPVYVQTLHRRGYRFVAPISERRAAPSGIQAAVPPAAPPVEPGPTSRVTPSLGGQLVPWSLAAIFGILAAVAVWQAVRRGESVESPLVRFTLEPVLGTRFDQRAPAVALSRDGTSAAWSGCDTQGCRLYVRRLDQLVAAAVPGTEGAAAPFFAPDGRALAFFADGHVKKVTLSGGAPVVLADAADPLGGVWTSRGRIVYAGAAAGLLQVPDGGGEPEPLTEPRADQGEVRHAWPALSPSGDLLFFTAASVPGWHDDSGRLAVMEMDRAPARWTTLLAGVGRAQAVADALVFSRNTELQAVGFDRVRTALAGTPVPVATGIATTAVGAHFAASPAGALLYTEAAPAATGSPLVWWTPSGLVPGGERARPLAAPALAPDGARLAGSDPGAASRSDVWIVELGRAASTRLTHAGVNVSPVWSPDGRMVYYASRSEGAFEIWRRDAGATGPAARLHASGRHAFPVSASPDGTLLAFQEYAPAARWDVSALPLSGGTLQPLVQTPFDDVNAMFSPDGQLVAYQSNEAGRWNVYVQRRADGRRTAVSAEGGERPFWSPDGRALYYRGGDRLMRASVGPASELRIGASEPIGDIHGADVIGVDSAGRVLIERGAAGASGRAIVALNWTRELRQLLGPPTALLPR